MAASSSTHGSPTLQVPERSVLVLYSFFDGDEVSWGNLQFFVQHAIQPHDGADYVLILNGADTSDPRLPPLPGNARYVHHENECYDWGTYAWALNSQVHGRTYRHYIFMNSSVRGPIMPWYASALHWSDLFTRKLKGDTKLVGPAISCEHFCLTTPLGGTQARQCRRNAHVQSVAVATDEVGLATLRNAEHVLKCHANRNAAVFYGEIGASLAILEAGFAIDSFQTRYQGVDWQNRSNWECNGAVTPIGKRTFDGVTLSAFELVFPKLKGSLLKSGLASHFEALKASEWLSAQPQDRNITSNWFLVDGKQVHAEDVVVAQARGQKCFDWDFYKRKNPDVAAMPQERMWAHFLSQGATQFREHRWLCDLDADSIIPHR